MKFLFLGGDKRTAFTAEALLAAGGTVLALGMDRARLPEGAEKVTELCEADCYILPLPAESGKSGRLNAPFSDRELYAAELLEKLPEGAFVCGGRLSPELKLSAQKRGLRLVDLLTLPDLVTGNAAITAEGAVSLLMQRTDCAIFGESVLIIGFGRIGRLLCRKLSALGVSVHVMSVSPESRAMAAALGYVPHSPNEALPPLCAVINTAPAAVLTELSSLCSPCLVLELASAPGGFEPHEVTAHGHTYYAASGLPASYAPRTAGRLAAEAVLGIVKEYNHE